MHLRNLLTAALTALLLGVAGCAGLPAVDERPPSAYLRDTSATRLARAIQPSLAAHPGQTGVALLRDGADAFTIRRTLADAAERSLDIQCYIWRDDTSGELMFDALRRAARRGVRVRLLLDDINTQGLDAKLFALDRIPGIEVRLFNPFANRSWRFIEMVTDFHRVNRRMHNKS
ncbi:MAG TPA: phospholipase D-like domain-containing protein, partial [Burkholderiaceae bacterium]|nr:phospholipase D-like domain-containing protein [Burkholderiaceae bacterium]